MIEALCRVADRGCAGAIQISSKQDVTYEHAARHIATAIGADQNLIQPVRAASLCGRFRHIPRHTTLDTTRLSQELGLTPPDVWAAIDLAIST